MATKNIKEKPRAETGNNEKKAAVKEKKNRKYFSGIGRRKLAVARVRIFENGPKSGKSEMKIEINEKPYEEYFTLSDLRETVVSPIKACGEEGKGAVSVRVRGGGIKGQAEAVRLGIARALVALDENFRKPLRDLGFLTRDDRVVERKKAGLKKARRAPQWKKR